MKHIVTALLLASIFCLTPTRGLSQITLTYSDFLNNRGTPNAQNSYSSSDTTGLRALENLSGAGVSWAFGNRVYTRDNTTPTSTSTLLDYPGGAALASDPDFSMATKVSKDVPNDPMKATTYMFIKADQTGLWFCGVSQDSMGVQSKVMAFSPPKQQFKFPMTYQTSWQSTSTIKQPGMPPGVVMTQTITAVVDGYGTLHTPSNPVQDALRLRTQTIQTLTIPLVGSQTDTSYSFSWNTNGYYGASISADAALRPYFVSYTTPKTGGAVARQLALMDDPLTIRLSNNPVSNTETQLFYTMKSDGYSQVSLMDALGRNVRMLQNGHASAGQNIIPIDPTALTPGTYFVHVNADGVTATRKLVITR